MLEALQETEEGASRIRESVETLPGAFELAGQVTAPFRATCAGRSSARSARLVTG